MSKTWYVYVLQCADGSLYTGITTDLERRLNEHNNTRSGAKYTRSRRPVKLVAYRKANDRSEAARREAAFKKNSRARKVSTLRSANSTWTVVDSIT